MNQPVLDVVRMYQQSQLFFALVKLGVLDIIQQHGPLTAKEIANIGKFNEEKLFRVLRASVAHGFLAHDAQGDKFSLNDLSRGAAGDESWKWFVLHVLGTPCKQSWGLLAEAVKDNIYPYEVANGVGLFGHLGQDTAESTTFNKAMTKLTADQGIFSKVLVQNYPFTSFKKIVDVGGGHGVLLANILRATPEATGIVFDLPATAESGKELLKTSYSDVANRLEFVGGDFFVSVPSGGNIYISKLIIHDWNDEKATQILKSIHRVIPDDGKLVILDQVIKGFDDKFGTILDVHMLTVCDGKERSAQQFEALFESGGFKLTKIIPLPPTPFHVIEGVKK